jgi:carbamoylphosphate synthase large subunit
MNIALKVAVRIEVEESGFAMFEVNPRVSRQAYIVLSDSLVWLAVTYMML